jgi:type IV pilus assembly protein PilQ
MNNNFKVFILFIILYLLPLKLPAADQVPFADSKITISMDFQDANLKDVVKILSIQSGLNFIASEAVQERKITLYLDRVPIKEVMDKLFKANNLTYELDKDANIFIVKDWGKPELETITRVYPLKYRSVPSANLEKEKGSLLTTASGSTTGTGAYSSTSIPGVSPLGQPPGVSTATSNVGATGGAGGIVTSLKQILSNDGKISEDKSTNSLIITDIPSRFPEIEHLIACLDVPQPQVMLDVEILDVSKNVVDKLGF